MLSAFMSEMRNAYDGQTDYQVGSIIEMKGKGDTQFSSGRRVAIIASVITALMAVGKYIVGNYYNSEILIADATHSIADTVAIFASAFGLYLAGKSKTERFPYGLYRAETLALFIAGIFIIYASIGLISEAISILRFGKKQISFQLIPLFTAISAMIISIVLSCIEFKTARKIKSRSLEVNAKESFYDVITSSVVIAGIILPSYDIPYITGLAVLIISLIILKIGVEGVFHSILILLDADIDRELKENIKETVLTIRGIKDLDNIGIRESGPIKMVELGILISPSATVYSANDLSEKIKERIYHDFDNIETIFINVKPAKNEIYRAVIPVANVNGLDSKIYPHFGRSKFFAIVKVVDDDIEIEDFYLNEFINKEKHIGIKVVKTLKHYNIDLLFTEQIGEISFYILKDYFVDICRLPKEALSIRDAVKMFRDGNLEMIKRPTHSVDDSMVNN